MGDFMKLSKDYGNADDDEILRDYLMQSEEGLNSDDIDDIMEDKFNYDADIDEESTVRQRKLAKKREIVKARKFFT